MTLGSQSTSTPTPRRGRLRQRYVLGAAVVGLFVATLSAGQPSAQATPSRVLQSVGVSMGSDGSVDAIKSTLIEKGADGGSTSESTSLDPQEQADQLPVRVSTAWRMGSESGTDLSDLKGRSGRVVIDLTVQNTTSKSQRLTYDTADGSRRSFALVGVPLTVFATAQLPGNGLAQVVTDDDSTPDEVTDGAVSATSGGGTAVQWAAMLAPPRLPGSRTFRLVEDVKDFTPPTFDLSVQPGLVTDGSVTALMNSAFSDDRSSTLQMETRTIQVIGSVNEVLTRAGLNLRQLRAALGDNAAQLGTQAIADLKSSNDHVSSALTGVSSDLDSLSSTIQSSVTNGNRQVLDGLKGSLDAVKSRLGDPNMTEPKVGKVNGCSAPTLKGNQADTVYGQILLIGAQLKTLNNATKACSTTISKQLKDVVGTLDQNCIADPTSDKPASAICVLSDTQTDLANTVTALSGLQDTLQQSVAKSAVAHLVNDMSTLRSSVLQLASNSNGHGNQGGPADDIQRSVNDVVNALAAVSSDAGTASGNLTDTFGTLHTTAANRLSAINGGNGVPSMGDKATAVAAFVAQACGIPANYQGNVPPTVEKYLDDMTASCANGTVAGQAVDLKTFVSNEFDAWTSIYNATDTGSQNSQASQLIAKVQQLKSDIDAQKGALTSLSVQGGLFDQLANITQSLGNLIDDQADEATCPANGQAPADYPTGDTDPVPPLLDRLLRSSSQIDCAYKSIELNISTNFSSLTDLLDKRQTQLEDSKKDADAARQAADDTVGALTSKLGKRIGGTANRLETKTKKQVKAQQKALGSTYTEVAKTADRSTTQALAQVVSSVGASTKNLAASESMLVKDLQAVLVDIGSSGRGGTGLLGTIRSGATATSVSEGLINQANRSAAAFGNVRESDLAEINLQRAQLTRALEMQAAFPAFGVDLPEGSQHLTVFTYHVGD